MEWKRRLSRDARNMSILEEVDCLILDNWPSSHGLHASSGKNGLHIHLSWPTVMTDQHARSMKAATAVDEPSLLRSEYDGTIHQRFVPWHTRRIYTKLTPGYISEKIHSSCDNVQMGTRWFSTSDSVKMMALHRAWGSIRRTRTLEWDGQRIMSKKQTRARHTQGEAIWLCAGIDKRQQNQ